jgi:hypothetical protein
MKGRVGDVYFAYNSQGAYNLWAVHFVTYCKINL